MLADVLHGTIVVHDHAFGTIGGGRVHPQHSLGGDGGGRSPLHLTGGDGLLHHGTDGIHQPSLLIQMSRGDDPGGQTHVEIMERLLHPVRQVVPDLELTDPDALRSDGPQELHGGPELFTGRRAAVAVLQIGPVEIPLVVSPDQIANVVIEGLQYRTIDLRGPLRHVHAGG